MKNTALLMSFLFIGFLAEAQVNSHAIGLRLGGDGDVNGVEISYQQGMGSNNRLELDLGFRANRFHSRTFLAGIYHWSWNISEGFNWYLGPGAAVGLYSYDFEDNYLNVGVGGQLGIEYDFNAKDAPFLISLDTRPMWDLVGNRTGFGWGVALGLRYTW